MNNGFQNAQGYGVNSAQTELQRQLREERRLQEEMQLAANLASLPNTDLGYDWLGAEQPRGGMVGNHFVPPSMSQHLNGAAKQGLGGLMVKRRGDMASALAQALAARYAAGGAPGGASQMPSHEIDSLYGQ